MQVERVDFIAVPVTDLAAADEFYGEVVGLARNPGTSGDRWVEYETGNLTLALSTFGGGIGLRVPDVGEARAELEEGGVEFTMETFDSGVCNGAPFTDPDGNRFLLHRRYAPIEPVELPASEVERTDYLGVNVRDLEAAARFYGGSLDLPRDTRANDEYPEFETGNVVLLTTTPRQKGWDGEYRPQVSIALRVPDVAASMERLAAKGVDFELPEVADSGVCKIAFFADPDGNRLILHHRYAPYRDGSTP